MIVLAVPTMYGRSVDPSSAPDACALGRQKALNGNTGYYRSADGLSEPGPSTARATAIGLARITSINYVECTNSCSDVDVSVAFIELAAPADPGRTTLQILERVSPASKGRPRVDFAEYLDRLAVPEPLRVGCATYAWAAVRTVGPGR